MNTRCAYAGSSRSSGQSGIPIASREAFQISGMEQNVADCVERAIRKLEDLGAEVVEVTIPSHLNASLIGRVHRSASKKLFGQKFDKPSFSDLHSPTIFWVEPVGHDKFT